MNDFNIELEKHLKTGFPMPKFYHLVYYNFKDKDVPNVVINLILSNYKVFKPYYKKLKKLRNRNYFPFDVNVFFINKLISKIESRNINYFDYKSKRRQFNKVRNKIFLSLLKNNDCCLFCKSRYKLTVDHKLAIINGGSNKIENMQILCHSCNSKKGSKLNYTYND